MSLLSCENLTFAYRRKKVIDGLDLEFEAGFFYAILGPNGCGKTTLIDLLAGHCKPASGSVSLQGRKLSSFSRRELARKIALVPQCYNINFPYTAAEIVMMGRYPHLSRFAAIAAGEKERVAAVMRATDTVSLGPRPVTELSGGERQRVVFARALVQDTPILFLDEATANLDINHTLRLLSLVKQNVRQKKQTVVAVFQDLNLAAACCDRFILLHQGKVEVQGELERVLHPEPIAKVFGVEAKVYTDPCFGRKQVIFKHP